MPPRNKALRFSSKCCGVIVAAIEPAASPFVPVINPLEFNVVVVVACNADVPDEMVKPFVPVINPLEFNVVVVVACNTDVPVQIVKPFVPVIHPAITVG